MLKGPEDGTVVAQTGIMIIMIVTIIVVLTC